MTIVHSLNTVWLWVIVWAWAAGRILRLLQIISTVTGKFYNSWSLLKIVPVLYRSAPFIGEEVGGRVEATSLYGRVCRVEDVEVAAPRRIAVRSLRSAWTSAGITARTTGLTFESGLQIIHENNLPTS